MNPKKLNTKIKTNTPVMVFALIASLINALFTVLFLVTKLNEQQIVETPIESIAPPIIAAKVEPAITVKPENVNMEAKLDQAPIIKQQVQGLKNKKSESISLLKNAPTRVNASLARDYYATSKTHIPTNHRLLGLQDHPAAKIILQLNEWIYLSPASKTKPASLYYEFNTSISRFKATVQTGAKKGKVKYTVYADGELVYSTVLRTIDGPEQINVALNNAKTLRLEVDSAGLHSGSWGIWGDPTIER